MRTKWYGVGIIFKEATRKYICQFDTDLEKAVFSKKDSDFVKLNKVRWIDYSKKGKPSLVKLENYSKEPGFTNCIYVRKEFIDSVWPLKNLPILKKEKRGRL